MKTRSKVLMVAGVVVVLLGGMVLGQGPGRGQGWGPGPAHRAGGPNQGGMGMGMIPHAGGPMGPGACVFGCPFGPAHSSVLGPAAWSLNLTEAQIKQIRSIYDQARADADAVEQAVAKARIALHQAVVSGASETQIQAAAATLGTAIGNQAALHAKTLAAAKAVLTAEQRKDLDNLPGKLGTLQHSAQESNPVISGQSTARGSGSGGGMSLDQMFNAADDPGNGRRVDRGPDASLGASVPGPAQRHPAYPAGAWPGLRSGSRAAGRMARSPGRQRGAAPYVLSLDGTRRQCRAAQLMDLRHALCFDRGGVRRYHGRVIEDALREVNA